MYEDKKFDVRLIERHLAYPETHAAHITKEELNEMLANLPDVSDKCEPVKTAQPIRMSGDEKKA